MTKRRTMIKMSLFKFPMILSKNPSKISQRMNQSKHLKIKRRETRRPWKPWLNLLREKSRRRRKKLRKQRLLPLRKLKKKSHLSKRPRSKLNSKSMRKKHSQLSRKN
jgi:hypothetical protein